MTTAYQTTGVIRRGSLKIRNRAQMLEHLTHWRDGEVTLTIERKHAHRSTFLAEVEAEVQTIQTLAQAGIGA